MKKFTRISSTLAVLDIDNIDTDQIIGSDHLKITNKEGLGKHLFSDWRYLDNGENNPDFVFNQPITNGAEVLVAGDNFACGSSREHAPWALLDFGIKVVISSSIADIFSNNAVKNGLLPIQVSDKKQRYLASQNGAKIEVDLQNKIVKCDEKTFSFEIESFARYCLLNGIEQLDFLLDHVSDINEFEKARNEF